MTIFKSLAVAGAMMAATASAAEEQFITIGTGGQTGVYFPQTGLKPPASSRSALA